MAQVYLPRSLLALFPLAERRPVIDASSVDELIERLDARWPGMRARLCEAGPTLREHINVFVDGDRATLGTPLEPTSIVHVIPAVSGGAPAMPHCPGTELAGRQSRVCFYRPRRPEAVTAIRGRHSYRAGTPKLLGKRARLQGGG